MQFNLIESHFVSFQDLRRVHHRHVKMMEFAYQNQKENHTASE